MAAGVERMPITYAFPPKETPLFLASLFPRAIVIAIEADLGNYELLVRNTRDNQRICTIHGAVWHRSEAVVIANEQDDPWTFQVKSAHGESTIKGLTLSSIISECGFEKIDLLKLDMEGAEREVFEAAGDWISKTDVIVELHERFRPGCEAAFLNAARRFRFEITQRNTYNIVVQRR
jgi:FkbM family methyltransferase